MDESTRTPRPCFFTVTQLLMAWTALIEGQINVRELRVYFALAVLKGGRRRAQTEAAPKFTLSELRGLVGAYCRERQAVGKLLAVGLLRDVSPSTIEFATDPSELHFVPQTLDYVLVQFSRARRRVPVPRNIVRLIASGARRSFIATIIGHLIYCSERDVSHHPEGYVSTSWIGQDFGVSERAVMEQRQHLIALGWLLPRPTPQRTLNLHGGCYAINFGWTGAVLAKESLGLPPLHEPSPASASLVG